MLLLIKRQKMVKILGWIFIILGALLIVLKLTTPNLVIISQINILWSTVVGAILIVAGFLFLKQDSKQENEVPIYQDKGKKRKIVGYRRLKN